MPPTPDTASTKPVLIYVHGFISSPRSEKAQETQAYCAKYRPDIQVLVPQLSNYMDIAQQQLSALLDNLAGTRVGLVGSSLGGLYGAWLSAVYGCKAVLVNPAVFQAERYQLFIGEHHNMYTNERFTISQHHIDTLATMGAFKPSMNKLMVLLQTGDETLDYRHAATRYAQAKTIIEHGGNHRFEGYQHHLPQIVEFLEL